MTRDWFGLFVMFAWAASAGVSAGCYAATGSPAALGVMVFDLVMGFSHALEMRR